MARSNEPTCDSCRAFDAGAQECRKNPPIAMVLIRQPAKVAGPDGRVDPGGPQIISAWPPVRMMFWCRSHEPKASLAEVAS